MATRENGSRATTALVPYTTLVQQFKSAPPGKLYCLHGSSGVFRLSLYAAAHALLNGIPITLVDGTNRFDVYYIAEFARRVAHQPRNMRRLAPEQLLENIFVSRAFTCYQMEATLTERLPAFVKRNHSPIAIIFGLLDTFYDEQAPLFEVNAGVQRIVAALHRLKQENVSVLLASVDMKLESTERNGLFPKIASAMDRVFSVTESEGMMRILHEPSNGVRHVPCMKNEGGYHGKDSANIHAGDPAGNGELVKVPKGTTQGRSGSLRRDLPGGTTTTGKQRICRAADTV